jgi:hypothetical protein
MKALNRLNYFMVGFPTVMALLGWLFYEGLWLLALLFTIITGAFQVIVGIGTFIDSGCRNKYFGIYLIAVAIFFLLWTITNWKWIAALPPLLALYMTALLFIEAKQEGYES